MKTALFTAASTLLLTLHHAAFAAVYTQDQVAAIGTFGEKDAGPALHLVALVGPKTSSPRLAAPSKTLDPRGRGLSALIDYRSQSPINPPRRKWGEEEVNPFEGFYLFNPNASHKARNDINQRLQRDLRTFDVLRREVPKNSPVPAEAKAISALYDEIESKLREARHLLNVELVRTCNSFKKPKIQNMTDPRGGPPLPEPSTAEVVMHVMELMRQQQLMMQQMIESNASSSFKVEGSKLPSYGGALHESYALFYEQVEQYFEARNVDWRSSHLCKRVLATLAGALRGAAAQWYIMKKADISTVDEFFEELEREFVPADFQVRLRDRLRALNQKSCQGLSDYVTKFSYTMTQVEEMSELDKVVYFTQGMLSNTRKEVQYRRCETLAAAVTVALDFERAHFGVSSNVERSNRGVGRSYHQRRTESARRSYDEAVPMEVDNVQVITRDECMRKNLCFYCRKEGHRKAECRARQRVGGVHRSGRAQVRVNAVQEQEEDEDIPVIFDKYTINTVELETQVDEIAVNNSTEQKDTLIRKKGSIGDREVTILLDCGASANMIRPGLASKVIYVRQGRLQSFDGTLTTLLDISTVEASVAMKEGKFQDVRFTESDLAPEHDVIFGLPWFRQFDPKVSWETHEFTVEAIQSTPVAIEESEGPSSSTEQQRVAVRNKLHNDLHLTVARRPGAFPSSTKLTRRLDANRFAELFVVKVSAVMDMEDVPEYLKPLVKEFDHVFPERLPEGLPPERLVQVQVEMKPDTMPSSRAPFRLSKTEQEALDVFINENLKKGWIEVSNSPWVSNIFGIPKKDPSTGRIPKRAEWLRSGNSAIPIRWVIDYRYANSQTKIPLPLIEELLDQMSGCTVFTAIDLAQGYHQMLVEKQSRQYTAFRSHKETYQ
ncbi:Retroelement pol polyprotein, partial [Globisporangium splendens]